MVLVSADKLKLSHNKSLHEPSYFKSDDNECRESHTEKLQKKGTSQKTSLQSKGTQSDIEMFPSLDADDDDEDDDDDGDSKVIGQRYNPKRLCD